MNMCMKEIFEWIFLSKSLIQKVNEIPFECSKKVLKSVSINVVKKVSTFLAGNV